MATYYICDKCFIPSSHSAWPQGSTESLSPWQPRGLTCLITHEDGLSLQAVQNGSCQMICKLRRRQDFVEIVAINNLAALGCYCVHRVLYLTVRHNIKDRGRQSMIAVGPSLDVLSEKRPSRTWVIQRPLTTRRISQFLAALSASEHQHPRHNVLPVIMYSDCCKTSMYSHIWKNCIGTSVSVLLSASWTIKWTLFPVASMPEHQINEWQHLDNTILKVV